MIHEIAVGLQELEKIVLTSVGMSIQVLLMTAVSLIRGATHIAIAIGAAMFLRAVFGYLVHQIKTLCLLCAIFKKAHDRRKWSWDRLLRLMLSQGKAMMIADRRAIFETTSEITKMEAEFYAKVHEELDRAAKEENKGEDPGSEG